MKKIALLFLIVFMGCSVQPSEAQTVYITKTGKKYHRSTCQYLRLSKIDINLSEAKRLGYTACSVCKPVTVSKDSIPSMIEPVIEYPAQDNQSKTPTTQKKSTTRQCSALTKSGLRCKRTTSSSNGKCWQHE